MSAERRMAAAALLISVFLAGGVGGAALMTVTGWGRPDRMPSREFRFPSGGMREPGRMGNDSMRGRREFAPMMLSERLSRELGLSEEQARRVQEILEERQARSSQLMQEMAPRLQAQVDSMQEEIRTVLTPSQLESFDQYLQREREFLSRRMERMPPWMPPGGASPGMPPSGNPHRP